MKSRGFRWPRVKSWSFSLFIICMIAPSILLIAGLEWPSNVFMVTVIVSLQMIVFILSIFYVFLPVAQRLREDSLACLVMFGITFVVSAVSIVFSLGGTPFVIVIFSSLFLCAWLDSRAHRVSVAQRAPTTPP